MNIKSTFKKWLKDLGTASFFLGGALFSTTLFTLDMLDIINSLGWFGCVYSAFWIIGMLHIKKMEFKK